MRATRVSGAFATGGRRHARRVAQADCDILTGDCCGRGGEHMCLDVNPGAPVAVRLKQVLFSPCKHYSQHTTYMSYDKYMWLPVKCAAACLCGSSYVAYTDTRRSGGALFFVS